MKLNTEMLMAAVGKYAFHNGVDEFFSATDIQKFVYDTPEEEGGGYRPSLEEIRNALMFLKIGGFIVETEIENGTLYSVATKNITVITKEKPELMAESMPLWSPGQI